MSENASNNIPKEEQSNDYLFFMEFDSSHYTLFDNMLLSSIPSIIRKFNITLLAFEYWEKKLCP